jgi:hypothetical protein
MTPDPIVLGQQAERAMEQFLAPAFDAVAAAYTDRLSEIASSEPWAADKIVKLALANRVLREVRNQIDALIAAGDVARAGKAQAEKIAAIPIERRRLMGMLPIN